MQEETIVNALDYIILGTFFAAALKGFLVGGVDKVFKIAGVLLAIYFCLNYTSPISDFIMKQFDISNKLFTSLGVIFVISSVTLGVFHTIAEKATNAFKALGINLINRLIGAFLGIVIAIAVWGGIFMGLDRIITNQPTIFKASLMKNFLTKTEYGSYDIESIKDVSESIRKNITKQVPFKDNSLKENFENSFENK